MALSSGVWKSSTWHDLFMPGIQSIVGANGAELIEVSRKDVLEKEFAIQKDGLTILLDNQLIYDCAMAGRYTDLTQYIRSELAKLTDDMARLYALADEAQVAERRKRA